MKITLTVEASPQLFTALLAVAGTAAALLANSNGGSLKNTATIAALMVGLLCARRRNGLRSQHRQAHRPPSRASR